MAMHRAHYPNHFPQHPIVIQEKSSNPTSLFLPQTVYEFRIGDVEDPVFAAQLAIKEWLKSDQGKWCSDNLEDEMVLHVMAEMATMGYRACLVCKMSPTTRTHYLLRWGNKSGI